MSDSTERRNNRIHAAPVSWPRGPLDLTSTERCPACFTPLHSGRCSRCGLDLSHPASSELLEVSRRAATALDERLELIGRIRFETDAAAQARAHTAAEPPSRSRGDRALDAGAPARIFSEHVDASRPEEHDLDERTPSRAQRKALSVPVLMLIVGVSALSVGAIFFLVYAFVNYGIAWRSIIIGAITIAAFAVANVLARRGLRATAEGISAFAVVLVYLDAFALRANDLLGAASVDSELFWGCTLVLSAAGFIGWHRASGLRAPSIAGFSTFAPGTGLVVASATADLPASARFFLVAATIAFAGIVHVLASRATPTPRASGASPASRASGAVPASRASGASGDADHQSPVSELTAERSIVLATSVVALACASIAAMAVETSADDITTSALALLASAIIAATHIGALRSLSREHALPRRSASARPAPSFSTLSFSTLSFSALSFSALSFSAFLGIDLAILGFAPFLHGADPVYIVLVPVVIAAAVALGIELGTRLMRDPMLLRCGRTAAWSATLIAVIAVLVPLAVTVFVVTDILASSLEQPWRMAVGDLVATRADWFRFSVVALVVVAAMTGAAWAVSGVVRSRARLLYWFVAAVLILAVPLLGGLGLVLAGWFAISLAALASLIAFRHGGDAMRAVRPPLLALLGTGAALGWIAAWASEATWAVAAVACIGVAVAARVVVAGVAPRAALLGTAAILVLVASGTAARQLTFDDVAAGTQWTDSAHFVGIVAAVLLIAAALPIDRVASALDRRTLFWISGPVAVAAIAAGTTAVIGTGAGLLAEAAMGLAAAALLMLGLLAWVAPRSTATFRIERIAASVAMAPAVYLLVDAFVRTIDAPDLASSVAPVTAALLTSAGSLTVSLLRPSTTPRALREVGVAIVAVPAVFSAVLNRQDTSWLVLLLGAVTALLVAISGDGLFASRSRRRGFGWVALALATAGLWWRLADDAVREVELYVLPIAGVLLLVATLVWRAARAHEADNADAASRAAPLIALAGLLVAILPVSAYAAQGTPLRALIVVGVSAGLLVLGSTVIGSRGIRPYLEAAALAGAIGVIVTSVGRSVVLLLDDASGFEIEAWLAFAVLVLVFAGFGLTRDRADAFERQRRMAGQALAVIGLTAVAAIETVAIAEVDSRSALRAVAAVLLFSTVHVLAFLIDRAPFTRLVAWLSLGFAATVAAVGTATTALDPLETGTIPIAIALLTSGVVHLGNNPEARSWRWLGPGVAVLLLPSLLATAEDRPLWRVVGIGVLGVAIILVSVVRRLQAPFLIASAVVLVHIIATLTPQIRAAYEALEWWLWLGIGGVILIVLAARYEQRIRNLRELALRIGSLR